MGIHQEIKAKLEKEVRKTRKKEKFQILPMGVATPAEEGRR